MQEQKLLKPVQKLKYCIEKIYKVNRLHLTKI